MNIFHGMMGEWKKMKNQRIYASNGKIPILEPKKMKKTLKIEKKTEEKHWI